MSDYHYVMRPTAFLDLAQDMAVKGAEYLNFSDLMLKEHGCAWILARMHTRFERPVRFDETGRMLTWHRGMNGLYFIRDYQMVDAEGKVAVNSTSSWIVMDFKQRRICRDEKILSVVSENPQSLDQAIAEPAPKIVLSKNAVIRPIGSHHVNYSDVDYNMHANNVKYTEWALDALPADLVYKHFVRELSINFNKEARPGDTVDLFHAEADGAHVVEGRVDDTQVFILKILFDE